MRCARIKPVWESPAFRRTQVIEVRCTCQQEVNLTLFPVLDLLEIKGL